jgi:uncharacterized membrane protein
MSEGISTIVGIVIGVIFIYGIVSFMQRRHKAYLQAYERSKEMYLTSLENQKEMISLLKKIEQVLKEEHN